MVIYTRKTGRVIFLLLCAMLLSSITMYGCESSGATVAQPQHISLFMPPAVVSNSVVVEYSRVLSVGERVAGDVNVNGEWDQTDMVPPWTFEVINPSGDIIASKIIQALLFFDDNPYYHFDFTADAIGKYTLRIIHSSAYAKDLDILVSPGGWQLETPAT